MARDQLETYQKEDQVQPTSTTPNFSGSLKELGDVEGGALSQIGATVAQSANTELAKKWGYEMGQTPKGDLLPPITNFDKQVADSYHTQAAATISLQANKLMMDTDEQVNSASRLTPELIAKSQQSVSTGLENILKTAPTAIKGQLSANFSAQMMNQTHQYNLKMISQNKDDQRGTLIASLNENARVASNLAMSGNIDAAQRLVDQSKGMAKAGVNGNLITPDSANVASHSVEDAVVNGKFVSEALNAKANGNFEKWEKDFADADPKKLGISPTQKLAAGQAVISYMGTLDSMRAQDENLRSAQMLNSIAEDPNGITGSMLQEFKENVSPLKYEEIKLKYIQSLKKAQTEGTSIAALIQNYSDPEIQAQASSKTKNAAFNNLVDGYVQQSNTKGNPITKDDAEVQVAASSGAPVPGFVSGIENKLTSANPNYIESAGQQMNKLYQMGAGHALVGLSDNAKAVFTKYQSLRDSMDPVTAAREATDAVLNQEPEAQRMNKEKWSNFMTASLKGGIAPDQFALKSVGLSKDNFINPGTAQVYGANILDKFGTYYQLLNGDKQSALKMTKQFVDENFGETGVNGGKNTTLHPLEKVLGYDGDHSVVPYIQQDVADQLNKSFMATKDAYSKKQLNEYWEVQPLDKKSHGIFSSSYKPIQVARHMRTPTGEKVEKFDVVLQGNAFDNWDVAVNSSSGMRNLFQIAPYLGVTSYIPNKKAIDAAYNKDHKI